MSHSFLTLCVDCHHNNCHLKISGRNFFFLEDLLSRRWSFRDVWFIFFQLFILWFAVGNTLFGSLIIFQVLHLHSFFSQVQSSSFINLIYYSDWNVKAVKSLESYMNSSFVPVQVQTKTSMAMVGNNYINWHPCYRTPCWAYFPCYCKSNCKSGGWLPWDDRAQKTSWGRWCCEVPSMSFF